MEKCAQHPGKMWVVRGDRMCPLLPASDPADAAVAQHAVSGAAARSTCRTRRSRSPGRAWCSRRRTIAGDVVVPFITEGYEGFDINDPHDWMMAERLIADGAVGCLPSRTVVVSA